MEQTNKKKGIFSVLERQKNIKNLVKIFKNTRESGETEVKKRKLFAEYGMETGISLKKFEEYIEMIQDREWIKITENDIIIMKEIENAL